VFGNIELSVDKSDNLLNITLTVPAGTTAKVVVPQGYNTLVCGDSKGTELTLTQGKYSITAIK
jgi:hypothetical protein